MPILSFLLDGKGSSGSGLTLAPVSNIHTLTASGRVYVKWTDPDDIIYDGSTLAAWAGTLLVRKAGSMPKNRRDGTIVLDSTTKNGYAETYFCDSGLTDGITYYYKLFPYTTECAYTDSTDNEFEVITTAQVDGIDNWDVTNISVAPEAGYGKIDITWTDPLATIESVDGITLATWRCTTVVVKGNSYAMSKDDSDAVYVRTVASRNQYSTKPLTISGLEDGGTYYISLFPETTDGGINASDTQRTIGVANRLTIEDTPEFDGGDPLIYNGSVQEPSIANIEPGMVTIGGTEYAVNAGKYEITFTPLIDYRWSDGSVDPIILEWVIEKADPNLEAETDFFIIELDEEESTLSVMYDGGGEIYLDFPNYSIETDIAYYNHGAYITFYRHSADIEYGEVHVNINLDETDNYCNSEISVIVKLAGVGSLEDFSWDEIDSIISAGDAPNYWSIGDYKSVNIDWELSENPDEVPIYATIIGFNHGGTDGTADFSFFIDCEGWGYPHSGFCFIDENYGNDSSDGTKAFNMNHSGGTNVGGWKACDMRYDILGSTDMLGEDATDTTTTSPVGGTLMAALPTDLRAVMKPMAVYTSDGWDSYGNITMSIDYLPLFSAAEVFIEYPSSNSNYDPTEHDCNQPYEYYKNGNERSRFDTNEGVRFWLLRTPLTESSTCFVSIGNSSDPTCYSESELSTSLGVAPVFRI